MKRHPVVMLCIATTQQQSLLCRSLSCSCGIQIDTWLGDASARASSVIVTHCRRGRLWVSPSILIFSGRAIGPARRSTQLCWQSWAVLESLCCRAAHHTGNDPLTRAG
ncbi:hypothetical protein BKA58DRAFT_386986 [Alternaria rosae]|uniref:uncharacterized protein n=1 Tax=Alternaria rosae TaxID=1187941 RepID=UPI001E8DD687|nr:uncharacterized protein BKA58DRAFT_386986 [Alternaria rosae]KAH6868495.1 hypothetical protein BKA58DRAFT_386986 [Alternaria rosae]